MQVLKEMPARKGGAGGGGRAPKYDYDKFLNGKVLKFVEGEDFPAEGKNPKQAFLSNVRTAAEQRGLKLVTRVDEDGVICNLFRLQMRIVPRELSARRTAQPIRLQKQTAISEIGRGAGMCPAQFTKGVGMYEQPYHGPHAVFSRDELQAIKTAI
jgi:hypothetical protein